MLESENTATQADKNLGNAVRFALLSGASAALGAALPSAAQAQAAAPQAGTPSDELQEVVITGSRIRRVDAETASPILTIDQKAIQESGISSIGELVARIPSVSGAATNPQVNNGGGFGESNIELRGLDAKRTLILVDGRRIGLVGASDATDVNQIPVALIERVEVLKEGAGAVYGSDAIGGVVNFITRKSVDGLELTGDYGRTTRSDGAHHSISALFGGSTDRLNVMIGGTFTKQEAVSAGNRDFSKFALYLYGGYYGTTPVKGGSSRTPTGRIFLPSTNPLQASLHCGVSSGQISVTRTAGALGNTTADYTCWKGAASKYNYQPQNLIMTPIERSSMFAKLDYQINDSVTAYASVLNNRTHSGFQIAPLPFDANVDDVVISAQNIYNPFGVSFGGLTTGNPDLMLRMSALGDRRSDTTSDSKIINGGVKGKLFSTGWDWDLNLTYSRLDQLATVNGYLLKSALAGALGPSFINAAGNPTCGTAAAPISGCVPVNFFNPTAPGQAVAIGTITGFYNTNNTSRYQAASLDFNGKVVDLPAGALQAAVGIDFNRRNGTFVADSLVQATPPLYLQCGLSNEACTGNTNGGYSSKQFYGELFAPILKDLPGVKALSFDLGVRYSDYTLFGKATKGDLKIEYRPVSDLLVRGTYSQVFRVPTVSDIAASPANSSITFNDPCTALTAAKVTANPNLALACVGVPRDGTFAEPNGQITGLVTGNPNLKPEKGTVMTYGVVFEPHAIDGLSLSVDIWHYKIEDLITTLDPNYSMAQCVATGSPTYCSLVTRFTSGANAGQILVFQAPTYNLGELKTNGVDFGVKYQLKNTMTGTWAFQADLTRIGSYQNTPSPGAVPTEVVGTYDRQFGNYAKQRALGSVNWTLKDFDALLSIRYISSIVLKDPAVVGTNLSVTPNIPIPDLKIPAFTYLDFTVGYNLPAKSRVMAGVRNLTDKQPPILYQNNVTNGNTDVQTYDTIGRQWWLSVSKKF